VVARVLLCSSYGVAGGWHGIDMQLLGCGGLPEHCDAISS